ncbi:Kiwa anti-phage protein KwaB-like domain-containing protein [Xanthomonas graminis]|uniref:Kiwa anti-phage protein KwaB-like domain-containing protein n=1 Tax=Xanthomonas graminis TaxID=3390026 RepID=UPI000A5B8227|nr:Kiwa anti-phage protein KwaB-like domain-containing protein [Xanthomonas translucens]
MINLFGYTKDPANRIVRFELDANLQAELSIYLLGQADKFDACEQIAFDGKYKPDEDECLVISGFDDLDSLANAVSDPMKIPVTQSEDILWALKALFFGRQVDGNWAVYLQVFDRRRLISNNGFSIFHSGNVYKRLEGAGLTIDSRITARLIDDDLKFRSFFVAKQIFDLSSHYQDATDADIEDFVQMKQVLVADIPKFKEISDSWVRRKVWLIQQSKILETVPSKDLKATAAEFGLNLKFDTDAKGAEHLVLPTDKRELKALLRFLDEDYYTSPLLKKNFRTNSKIPLN